MLTAAEVQGIENRRAILMHALETTPKREIWSITQTRMMDSVDDIADLLRDREELVGLLRECVFPIEGATCASRNETQHAGFVDLKCRVLAAIGGTE